MKTVAKISYLLLILIQLMTTEGIPDNMRGDRQGCITCTGLDPTPFTRKQVKAAGEVTYTNTSVIVCTGVTCWEIRYDALQQIFPDFLTSLGKSKLMYRRFDDDIPSGCTLEGAFRAGNMESIYYCSNENEGDGDYCCPTNICAACFFAFNFHSELCYALSKVTVGECGSDGQCHGSCLQEYTIQRLLVWNVSRECVGVYSFEIPTYCSCKKT